MRTMEEHPHQSIVPLPPLPPCRCTCTPGSTCQACLAWAYEPPADASLMAPPAPPTKQGRRPDPAQRQRSCAAHARYFPNCPGCKAKHRAHQQAYRAQVPHTRRK